MVIDFRVRAPFSAYASSPLFTQINFVEQDTKTRVDTEISASAKKFSMDLLIQEADAAGIDKLVVPVRKAVNGNNSDLVNLISMYPERIVGLAGIDVVNLDNSIKEIEKYVINGPCKGIILEPGQDKTPWMINDTWVYPLYDFCARNGVPIAFTYGGIMTRSLRYYAPEPLDDVASAFPSLRIALAHGGWPYVTEVCQIAVNRGNVYIAPDIYMVRSPGMSDYVMAANYLLRNRIIFSSAYPILPLKEAREAYENSGLRDAVLPLVLGDNAAEFLKL